MRVVAAGFNSDVIWSRMAELIVRHHHIIKMSGYDCLLKLTGVQILTMLANHRLADGKVAANGCHCHRKCYFRAFGDWVRHN